MSNQSKNSFEPAGGVYVALLTPREPNSVEANAAALLDYIDTIVRAGVDGLVLFGTTGEFVHYDIAERVRVLSLAIKRSRVPVLVNVSHSAFSGAIELAENAVEAGAAGVLLMPPYFFRYSDDQIFAFYQSFVKLIGGAIPIYLYNMPAFTNPLSASLMERLLVTGAFSGIKDSSGEWSLFEALQRLRPNIAFQNLTGGDRIYARARAAGADGIISGVAAAVPELMVALDRAILKHDAARVQRLDNYLQPLLKHFSEFPVPIAIKRAGRARGWNLDDETLPFDQATLAALSDFQRWFEEWLPAVLTESAIP